jgi:hypothetical protein
VAEGAAEVEEEDEDEEAEEVEAGSWGLLGASSSSELSS